MDRLARTRSQHFMHSPRKAASPLKLRHGSTSTRHQHQQPIKRRRLGSAAQTLPPKTNIFNSNGNSDTEDTSPEGSRRRNLNPLSSDIGEQRVNGRHYATKKDVRGKGKPTVLLPASSSMIFGSEDESSPRKRKRSQNGSGSGESENVNWIEVDENEDELEPEFIAESDQHLIDGAPAYALQRLRKAELVRLWKVAGMWEGEEGEQGSMHEDEDDQGLSKKELVDGLVAARKPHSSTSSSRNFASNKNPRRSTSATSLLPGTPISSDSSSSNNAKDTEATPRAVPRTRAKARVKIEGSVSRPRRPLKGVRERLLKARSKSMGGPGDKEERKARFGEDVKSPAHGLLARKTRRTSSLSSTYTTTDTSPPATPVNSRQVSRRRPSNSTRRPSNPARRMSRSTSNKSLPVEEAASSDSDDDLEPTPLVKRLRPRTKSTASEADADAEDESTEDEREASLFSPGPSSRLRSKGKSRSHVPDADVAMDADDAGLRRTRSAKLKAKEILAEGEGSTTEDDMDVDEEPADLTEEPQSIPLARIKSSASQPTKRHTRRNSRLLSTTDTEAMPISTSSSNLTPPPASPDGIEDMEVVEEETETETEATRTTRSGKAFGVWQSRRKRLRQEAMDDPDMDVEEDEEEEEESDEEQDSFEADLDLSDATISSLTRLLRDELVEMCEARGIEVGGTKPHLAKALLEWREEQHPESKSSTSSQATIRQSSSGSGSSGSRGAAPKTAKPNGKIIHAVGSNKHISGKTTPVLLRDHTHAHDPDTPPLTPPSEGESKRTNTGEAELNFDLQELGLEDTVIRPDLLQKLERIGSGGFKDVYVGKYRGRKVAISEFREHLSEMDIRELKLLSEFSHPNIVKFRGICIPEDNSQIPCMLVSELCENGDLFDYIRNVDCPTLKRLLGLMLDIAKGLEYLHTHTPPIIHRDCKSSNILINRAGHAKVGDFGLARVKNSTRSMIRSLVGTVNWQAPELWSPKPSYDYKVDVFSAGMVFWEMMSGWTGEKKYPWEGHNEHYIYDAVGTKHRRPTTSGLKKHWGVEPVALMERMWHQDPRERPTMTDVVDDLVAMYAAAGGR